MLILLINTLTIPNSIKIKEKSTLLLRLLLITEEQSPLPIPDQLL